MNSTREATSLANPISWVTITIVMPDLARSFNVNRVRQKMGMVFQQFNLFPHLTIMDNITLAPVLLKISVLH